MKICVIRGKLIFTPFENNKLVVIRVIRGKLTF